MSKKILVVHTSPRKGGNSQMLADAFIEGATEAGNEVKLIDVGHANIHGCNACEYCFSHEGKCCIDDEMQQYYPMLDWADVLIYATPMYCYSTPAQMRAFQDRMFCGIAHPFKIPQTGLLLCFEDKDITTADGVLKCFDICANYSKQEVIGKVVVNAVWEKGAIAGNKGLDEARKFGASIK